MSVPQANSTYTIDKPAPDTERTRATPGIPFMMLSIGNVTSCSTSGGASPSASVISVTDGRFKSGKTSIGMRGTMKMPYATSINAATSTNMRLRRLAETRALNTSASLANLIDQFGAADHDAVSRRGTGCNENVGGIERLDPNRPRLEVFGLDLSPD